MKNALLTIAMLCLISGAAAACHKCGKPHSAQYGYSSYAGVTSIPLSYSVPLTTYSAPLTYSVPLSTSVPAYYSAYPTTQSVLTSQPLTVQALSSPATVMYVTDQQAQALSDAQTQGLISDLIFGGGFVKPAGCQVCRSMGCCNDQGSSPTDPVKNLKQTIREIGDLIRSVKDLEKDIKDAVDGRTSVIESPPAMQDSQIAQLRQICDDIRKLNQQDHSTRTAQVKD